MPDRNQLAFVASFLVTGACLYTVSEFVKAQLHARGYYVSDLILLGLPKEPRVPPPHVTNGTVMADIFSGQYSQLIALALAVLTSVVVFMKFGRGSTCLRSFPCHALPDCRVADACPCAAP